MTSFKDEIARFRSGRNFGASGDDCLARLVDDDRIEEVWNKVQAEARNRHGDSIDPAKPFIQAILVSWARAEIDAPNYLELAAQLASLSTLLRRRDGMPRRMPPPPTEDGGVRWSRTLREIASWLCVQDAREASLGVRHTREGRTRKQQNFIRSMSTLMKQICGKPMNDQVRVVTEIVFQIRDIDVRPALRSTIRARRSSKR